MLTNTAAAVAAILRADPTISAAERARFLAPAKSDAKPSEKLIRLTEAAELLGVSRRTVSNLITSGALPGVKFPGRVRYVGVKQSAIRDLLENRGAA